MFDITWEIKIGKYKLMTLDSCTIIRSVEQLVDTAEIVLPGAVFNKAIDIEKQLSVGDKVTIEFGYDSRNRLEFEGYLQSISTDDDMIKLQCEDSLYLFRKRLNDAEHKNIKLANLVNTIISEIGINCSVECDYNVAYDKFVFYQATAYDVLKKVQEDLKANVYFINNTLHIHAPYKVLANSETVKFDFAINIEKSALKYVKASDKNVMVELHAKGPDGKEIKQNLGTTGGEVKKFVSTTSNPEEMKNIAKSIYNSYVYDGYEGSITGWLIPYCEPSYKVSINDDDYINKKGVYYAIQTKTSISKDGGIREITLGRRLE